MGSSVIKDSVDVTGVSVSDRGVVTSISDTEVVVSGLSLTVLSLTSVVD